MPSPFRRKSKWSALMLALPLVLEVLNLMRQSQKRQRNRFTKARKREKVFDFLLGQANKRLNKKVRRSWF